MKTLIELLVVLPMSACFGVMAISWATNGGLPDSIRYACLGIAGTYAWFLFLTFFVEVK